MKKLSLAVLLGVVVSGLVAGCEPKDNSSTTPAATNAPTAPAAPAAPATTNAAP